MSAVELERPALEQRTTTSRRLRAAGLALRLLLVVGLYRLYVLARDRHGLDAGPEAYETATRHADGVSSWSTWLPIPSERHLQEGFLDHELLLRAAGAFYGSAHFLVTLAALVYLGLRRARDFDRWGSVLGLSTFVSVAVFVLYPVAPPRLMPPGEATVDTLATTGGLWSYDHGFLERISDPFAALPSLHVVWAVWVAMVLWGARRSWVRVAGVGYPCLTVAAVLLTGNHWYEDIVLGALLVALTSVGVSALPRRRPARP